MTNEKILTKLAKIKSKILSVVDEGMEKYATAEIDDLIAEIIEEVNSEGAKQAGEGSVRSAAIRILNDKNNKVRPIMQKATAIDGRVVVSDGYRAVNYYSGQEPKNLPMNDEKAAAVYPSIDKIMEQCNAPTAEKIIAPTIASLKAFIARNKEEAKRAGVRFVPYQINEVCVVNAQYLIDCLQACEGEYIQAPTVLAKPVFIEGRRGTSILCPVRVNDEKMRALIEMMR